MKVREVLPSVDLEVDGRALDARKAAEKIFAHSPAWIDALLRLRNMIVTPLGLKTSAATGTTPREMIGMFPVLSETPDRLVAGFDDSTWIFASWSMSRLSPITKRSPQRRWC
jgi:hypothetical protein